MSELDTPIKVRHLGNTANNAFHNALVLREFADIESILPIQMFGLDHGMSAPAWEVVDFHVPTAEWVPQPDWASVPEAVELNSRYSDIQPPATEEPTSLPAGYAAPNFLPGFRRALNAYLGPKRWARPLVDLRTRQAIAKRQPLVTPERTVDILYGADSLMRCAVPPANAPVVSVEHGTVRWAGATSSDQLLLRDAYRKQLRATRHLWVTNLDPRSLEVAEEIMPGRWAAFPHPFMFDPRVPFDGDPRTRAALLSKTKASHLILLPSSQNWSAGHDKGSIKALNAFIELRRSGADVGMVAVEWGLQLAESKALLADAGVAGGVVWVPPMARLGLQRMMADVDVVWDQFGLDAFGALALRATEQGTPLVSRGLTKEGEALIGASVPWSQAISAEDIVAQTTHVLDEMADKGREAVIAATRTRYREWLLTHHSPRVTAALQLELYPRLLAGSHRDGDLPTNRWATMNAELRKDQ